jgi:hypothetical protein
MKLAGNFAPATSIAGGEMLLPASNEEGMARAYLEKAALPARATE